MLSAGLVLRLLGSRGDLRPDTNGQLLLRLSLLALAGLTVVRAMWPTPIRPISSRMNGIMTDFMVFSFRRRRDGRTSSTKAAVSRAIPLQFPLVTCPREVI